MKAAVLEYRGRDGLVVRAVAMPQRQPGEVLLEVHAAGMNRVDLYMRDNGSGITHSLPQTMGVEAAGVIVEADGLLAAYLTAWCMTFGERALVPGETVLIVGIVGGVAVARLRLVQRRLFRQLEVYGSTGGRIEECRQLIAVIDQRIALEKRYRRRLTAWNGVISLARSCSRSRHRGVLHQARSAETISRPARVPSTVMCPSLF